MAKDINKQPFDEATCAKLEIFERYLEAWLPVFIHSPYANDLMICDFFAGSGSDASGVPGSPLRILEKVGAYKEDIEKTQTRIHVLLNEGLVAKAEELNGAVADKSDGLGLGPLLNVTCCCDDF